jgi:hypothetical protein
MATGGFKASEYVFTYTRSTTASTVEAQVKAIVRNICNCIMQCEPHWQYDAEFTTSADDYFQVGTGTAAGNKRYAQFLINSMTGSRLMVYYDPAFLTTSIQSACIANGLCYGLCMSIIPGGGTEKWDTTDNGTTIAFIPNTGTNLLGFCDTVKPTNTTSTNTLINTSGTHTWRFVVIVKEDLITVFLGEAGVTEIYNGLSIGRIFGVLCNEEDNEYYSHYGAFLWKFKISTSSNDIFEASTGSSWASIINPRDTYYQGNMRSVYFRKSVATRPVMYKSTTVPFPTFTNNATFDGNRNSSVTSGKTSFGAVLLSYTTDDANSYGIVPGNSFKGYLDTDFFRTVYVGFQFDALFDSGKFIYAGGGWAIGWDPSNSITIHG